MNKKNKIIAIASIFFLCLFAVPAIVFSEDYVAYYDAMFEDGEFTLNTNETYEENNNGLYDLANNYITYYSVIESGNYNGDYSELRLHFLSCEYESMICNINLIRDARVGGSISSDVVKTYENINILINEENDFFDFVNEDNKIEINYDESMFLNDTEKNEYISDFIYKKSHDLEEGKRSNYSFSSDDFTITRVDSVTSSGKLLLYAKRVVSEAEFNYIDTPYSDEFKTLTSGTITIKTDDSEPINEEILESYIRNKSYVQSFADISYSFSIENSIRNSKAFIVMYEHDRNGGLGVAKEKHLINIVKDSNIDEELFENVGFDGTHVINADTPENQSDYASNYFRGISYNSLSSNSDGSRYVYSVHLPSSSELTKVYVICEKYDKNYVLIDYQYSVVPVSFNGYSDTFSEKYISEIGRNLTINSDVINDNSVSKALSYNYPVLLCNNDYSICDIGLVDDKNKTMEIHKVNIVFNKDISNKFKTIVNLNSNDELEILTDDGLKFDSYYSYYDDVSGDFVSYTCYEKTNCEVSVDNYESKYYEEHKLPLNHIVSEPSDFFKSKIGFNKELYVGETTDFWQDIEYLKIFGDDKNLKTEIIDCDETLKTCNVIVLNNNRKLEMHKVKFNVKTEKSPAFIKALPSETLKMNAIYRDDEDYQYMISMAYLLSKTKSWTYMKDFETNQAKVVFNDIESHTMDIEYTEGNLEHQAIIDEIIEKLDNADLKIVSTDLEFVNMFYYKEQGSSYSNNFNSKAFHDVMKETINNKHVGYFFVPGLGDGSYYTSYESGRIVLYYDGIGYGVTNNYYDVRKSRVIYIPDNTPDSIEEYVKAAQKRVDNYLGKDSGVKIIHNETRDDSYIYREDEDDSFFEDYGIDKDKYDGNDYLIMYNGEVEHMLIIKDSSKMQKPGFVATDVRNNLTVSSDNANYPTNTIISSEIPDESTEQLKKLLKNKGIKSAHIVDINLYSTAVGNITDFEGKDFEVEVPLLDVEFGTDELGAYYIDENGNVEEHIITMDDFMANFKTNHFSEYIILTRADGKLLLESPINPKTFDNVYSYVIIGFVSLSMLVLSLVYKKRFN